MKIKFTAIHGVIVMIVITIIIAATVVYIVTNNEDKYKNINSSDINGYVGEKVNVKLTPIEEIKIVPEVEGIQYRCEENNVVISSPESLELDKTIYVRGEVKEHENGFVLFAE